MERLKAILSIYAGGALIGLTLVSFPSSSVYFRDTLGLTDTQYGAIYLPQLVLAVIGALGGGWALRFMSLKAMLVTAFVSFFCSQAALAVSGFVEPSFALVLIMFATASFGFGFGFGGGPMNGIASVLFPEKANSGVTLLHMMAGCGLAAGPLIFGNAIENGLWSVIPLSLAAAAAILAVIAVTTPFPEPQQGPQDTDAVSPSKSVYFWIMMGVAILYSLAEGIFTNWAVIFAQEVKGLDIGAAGWTLSAFFIALTMGRLLATLLLIRIRPIALCLCLPPLMALALYLLPAANGEVQVIAGFAFAGFACSAFFPLLVAVTSEPYPQAISFIASMLTAALMVGVGLGSFLIGSIRSSISLEALYAYSTAYPLAALALILLARFIKPKAI